MKNLIKQYDELQKSYGSKELNSVYGCGEKGLRAQWLGTKQIREFLSKCELFSSNINEEIKSKKPNT